MQTGKNGSQHFWFFEKVFAKNVCPWCYWLCRLKVSIVVDWADTFLPSQQLRWDTGNYFTFEKEKTNDKSTKNLIGYFQNIKQAEKVVDYMNMTLAYLLNTRTRTRCWHSHWLRGHNNDYADQRIYISDRTHSTPLRLPKMCLTQPLHQRWNLQLK